MIEEFTRKWFAKMHDMRAKFEVAHPEDYKAVVRAVVEMLGEDADYDVPDPDRVHEINDGSYQGTLVYVIGAKGYQPSRYWYVRVFYGSCSGCDTLEAIRGWSDETPSKAEVDKYMTLALHVIQGLQEMGGEGVE